MWYVVHQWRRGRGCTRTAGVHVVPPRRVGECVPPAAVRAVPCRSTGILVSTVMAQSPKVISVVAQVDTLASFSSFPSALEAASMPSPSSAIPPFTPESLLPHGSFVSGSLEGVRLSVCRVHLFRHCVSVFMATCVHQLGLCAGAAVGISLCKFERCVCVLSLSGRGGAVAVFAPE